jgi:hypothetical protein
MIGEGRPCPFRIIPCVMLGRFWMPYIGWALGGELDLMMLIVKSGRVGCYPVGDEHVAE